jgi:3-carboxy-cis,cis-muconate cycloisomerase
MFSAMYSTPAATDATDDRAWLREMLRVESAIAVAGAAAGLIPPELAKEIEAACEPSRFDLDELTRRAVDSATPVVPLVQDLRALVPEAAQPYVHLGATSQDVIDTALVLIARRVSSLVLDDLWTVGDDLAELADRHRHAVQIGRTLLQRAVPTTFGAACAGWLAGVDDAAVAVSAARSGLPLQYGGPVGLGAGVQLTEALGTALDLPVPPLPWHTRRQPIIELATALAEVCGALATVATAVVLLAQNEIAELAEGSPGGSSAMPHKRNPARSALVLACAHQTPGLVAGLLGSQQVELQRSVGRWQAEAPTLTQLLRLTAAAAAHAHELVGALQVDTSQMLVNAGDQHGATELLNAADLLVDRALETHHAARP